MFNWFKGKVELKNEQSIMSSTYVKNGLKIGSEIIVPSNFKCLIFNNGKYYFGLESGKHKVSNDKFESLIIDQSKTKRKKHVKMVCHYINLSPQTITIRYKKQNYVVKFNITDSINFANLLLLYAFKVDNDYTVCTLNDVFTEGLLWLNGDYNKIESNFFEDYGITISSFKPENQKDSIFSSRDELLIKNQSENTIATMQSETTSNIKNTETTNLHEQKSDTTNTDTLNTQNTGTPNTNTPNTQFTECPKCKNITKFNTTYCLRCGYKLE